VVFRGGFPAARPEHFSRAGRAMLGYQSSRTLLILCYARRRYYAQDLRAGLPGVPGRQAARSQCQVRRWNRRPGAELTRNWGARDGERSSRAGRGGRLWTGLTLKLDLFQHPRLTRPLTDARQPWTASELWEKFITKSPFQSCPSRWRCNTPGTSVGCAWKERFRLGGRGVWVSASRIAGRGARMPRAGPETASTGTKPVICAPWPRS